MECLLPAPRSGVSVASRRSRLGARASSQLRLWLEMGAGAARRLNGRPSHRASGCYEAADHGPLHVRMSFGGGCGDELAMYMTCSPSLDRC